MMTESTNKCRITALLWNNIRNRAGDIQETFGRVDTEYGNEENQSRQIFATMCLAPL